MGLATHIVVSKVHFWVIWESGKFGLKKGTGVDPPPPVDNVPFFFRFFSMRASLSDLVENTLEQLAAMVAMSRPKELRQLEVVLDPRFKFETSFFSTFAIIQPLMKVSCHIECNFLHIFLTLSSCRDWQHQCSTICGGSFCSLHRRDPEILFWTNIYQQ